MKYLLATTGTIEAGVGFKMFDGCHLAWLGGIALFLLAMCLLYRRLWLKGRRIMRYVIAGAVLADEALKMAVLFIGGNFTVNYLPLHLCSINLFLIAWHALRPSRVLDNYLYAVCVPGALAALLFPSWTALPPSSLMHIHSFTFHALLVCYPLMLLLAGEIQPRLSTVPRVLLLLGSLGCIAAIANRLLGTNFMFLSYASKSNPLYWFKKNWGNHLLGYAVILPVLLAGLYGPELVRFARRLHRAHGWRRGGKSGKIA